METTQRLINLLGRLVSPGREPLALSEIFELIGLMRGYWLESDNRARQEILTKYVSRLPRAIEVASFPRHMEPGSIKLQYDQYPVGEDGALSFYVKYLPLDDRLSHRWVQVQFSFLPNSSSDWMCTLTFRDERLDYRQAAFFPLASNTRTEAAQTPAAWLVTILSAGAEYFLQHGTLPPGFSLAGSN